ncbi:hypothetical protein [Anaplasma phagocytophilum]|uniref:hypothetical protein n=1 Tax=Anaplasma phagocytophilum TaxID=948 RepID=UPI000A506975|nr:hypothetical protein [Anaplasma phagocytophilum]
MCHGGLYYLCNFAKIQVHKSIRIFFSSVHINIEDGRVVEIEVVTSSSARDNDAYG